MNTTPIVSICCVTYNHSEYIKDAIEGFLKQKTAFPIEIIIHDDASTDNTQEIINHYKKTYPELIFPIFQKENQYSKGLKPWPNFVFPRARGKYIALCEGDDYWTDPYKLQKQVDFLEENENIVLCGTNYRTLTDGIIENRIRTKTNQILNKEILLASNEVPTLTAVFRRPPFKITIPKNIPYSDWYLWVYLTHKSNSKFALISEISATQNIHKKGVFSSINNRSQLIVNAILLKEAFSKLLKHKNKELLNDLFLSYWNLKRNPSDYISFISKRLIVWRFLKYKILRRISITIHKCN